MPLTTIPDGFPFTPAEDPNYAGDIAKLQAAKERITSGDDMEGFDKWGVSKFLIRPRAMLSWATVSPTTFDAAEKVQMKAVVAAVPFDEMPNEEVTRHRTAIQKAVGFKVASSLAVTSSRNHTLSGSTFVENTQPDSVSRVEAIWAKFVALVGDETQAKQILGLFNASVVELGDKIDTTSLEELMLEAEQIRLRAIHLLAESRKK
jgi:hypothetical protein